MTSTATLTPRPATPTPSLSGAVLVCCLQLFWTLFGAPNADDILLDAPLAAANAPAPDDDDDDDPAELGALNSGAARPLRKQDLSPPPLPVALGPAPVPSTAPLACRLLRPPADGELARRNGCGAPLLC